MTWGKFNILVQEGFKQKAFVGHCLSVHCLGEEAPMLRKQVLHWSHFFPYALKLPSTCTQLLGEIYSRLKYFGWQLVIIHFNGQ